MARPEQHGARTLPNIFGVVPAPVPAEGLAADDPRFRDEWTLLVGRKPGPIIIKLAKLE